MAHSAIWNALASSTMEMTAVQLTLRLEPDKDVFYFQCCVLQRALTSACLITWNLTSRLKVLDYTYDICLLGHIYYGMQENLESVQLEAVKADLRINIAKTNVTSTITCNTTCLQIANQHFENVSSFSYLGNISHDLAVHPREH